MPLRLIRFVALFLIPCLVADPVTASVFVPQASADVCLIKIPGRYGTITDSFGARDLGFGLRGSGFASKKDYSSNTNPETRIPKPVVVLIQNLHCHREAQENTAQIITYLYRRLGVDRVGVEGAFSPVDVSVLRTLPRSARQEVLESLLQKGYLSGAELAAATLRGSWLDKPAWSPLQLHGLEDPWVYWQNLQAWKKAQELKGAALQEIQRMLSLLPRPRRERERVGVRVVFLDDVPLSQPSPVRGPHPAPSPTLRAGEGKSLQLLSKLIRLELTPQEYDEYLAHKALNPHSPLLTSAVANAEEFYRLAKQRDGILLAHAEITPVRRFSDSDKPTLMLVGGFHTAGIARRLRQQGQPFVVITPRITHLGHEHLYRERMLESIGTAEPPRSLSIQGTVFGPAGEPHPLKIYSARQNWITPAHLRFTHPQPKGWIWERLWWPVTKRLGLSLKAAQRLMFVAEWIVFTLVPIFVLPWLAVTVGLLDVSHLSLVRRIVAIAVSLVFALNHTHRFVWEGDEIVSEGRFTWWQRLKVFFPMGLNFHVGFLFGFNPWLSLVGTLVSHGIYNLIIARYLRVWVLRYAPRLLQELEIELNRVSNDRGPTDIGARTVGGGRIGDWSLAHFAHELGHLLATLAIIPFATFYSGVAFLIRTIGALFSGPPQTKFNRIKSLARQHYQFVLDYVPTSVHLFGKRVDIPGLLPKEDWESPAFAFPRHLFALLITLGGLFGMPVLSGWYIPALFDPIAQFSPVLAMAWVVLAILQTGFTLWVAKKNLEPNPNSDPNDDRNRLLYSGNYFFPSLYVLTPASATAHARKQRKTGARVLNKYKPSDRSRALDAYAVRYQNLINEEARATTIQVTLEEIEQQKNELIEVILKETKGLLISRFGPIILTRKGQAYNEEFLMKLCEYIVKYDPSKSSFSNYMHTHIFKAMQKYWFKAGPLRIAERFYSRLQDLKELVPAFIQQMKVETPNSSNPDHIAWFATQLKLGKRVVRELLQVREREFFGMNTAMQEDHVALETRSGEASAADNVRIKEWRHRLLELLNFLSPKHRVIYRLRNGIGEDLEEPRTFQEIGDAVGITRERVRQICGKIEKKLKKWIDHPDTVPPNVRRMESYDQSSPEEQKERRLFLVQTFRFSERGARLPPAAFWALADLPTWELFYRSRVFGHYNYLHFPENWALLTQDPQPVFDFARTHRHSESMREYLADLQIRNQPPVNLYLLTKRAFVALSRDQESFRAWLRRYAERREASRGIRRSEANAELRLLRQRHTINHKTTAWKRLAETLWKDLTIRGYLFDVMLETKKQEAAKKRMRVATPYVKKLYSRNSPFSAIPSQAFKGQTQKKLYIGLWAPIWETAYYIWLRILLPAALAAGGIYLVLYGLGWWETYSRYFKPIIILLTLIFSFFFMERSAFKFSNDHETVYKVIEGLVEEVPALAIDQFVLYRSGLRYGFWVLIFAPSALATFLYHPHALGPPIFPWLLVIPLFMPLLHHMARNVIDLLTLGRMERLGLPFRAIPFPKISMASERLSKMDRALLRSS